MNCLMRISLLAVLMLFAASARAADESSLVNDLQTLSAQLDTRQAYRSLLQQEKQIAGMSRPLRAEGELFFEPAEGVYYRLSKPVRAQYLISPNAILVQEGNGKTRRYTPDMWPGLAAIGALFNSVFRADWPALETHFRVSFQHLSEPASGWQLTLVPHDEKLRRSLPQLEVSGDKYIALIRFLDPQGAATTLHLSAPETPAPWPDAARQLASP